MLCFNSNDNFRNDRDIIRVLKANQDNGTGSVPVASELENYLICENKYVNACFISSVLLLLLQK